MHMSSRHTSCRQTHARTDPCRRQDDSTSPHSYCFSACQKILDCRGRLRNSDTESQVTETLAQTDAQKSHSPDCRQTHARTDQCTDSISQHLPKHGPFQHANRSRRHPQAVTYRFTKHRNTCSDVQEATEPQGGVTHTCIDRHRKTHTSHSYVIYIYPHIYMGHTHDTHIYIYMCICIYVPYMRPYI